MCKICFKVFITFIMIFLICFLFTVSSFADCNPVFEDCKAVYFDYEIFFYDGTNITQLTSNYSINWSPQINDSGQAVWYAENWDFVPISDGDGGGGGGSSG